MRITAELITRSPSYLNPLKERELDLRGNKISVIENLGATQDQYDSIDLSDNEITKLENFPYLHRLRTLLLNNNKIQHIGSLGDSLPSLESLILTNNKLNNLSDIDSLSELPNLKRLSLLDNLITKKQNYRLYVIHKLPHLKLLDFQKIKKQERIASEKLFGSNIKIKKDKKQEQIKKVIETKSGLTPEQIKTIKEAFEKTTTMEEFAALERQLSLGQFPGIANTNKK